MKACDLAAELMKHPDFEVRFVFSTVDDSEWGLTVNVFDNIEINDIGYSNKIISLGGDVKKWD